MLKKSRRLTTASFQRFFKSGRRLQGSYMQLLFTPYHSFHGSVVVGKKVSKKAVVRNKLRRQVYALLSEWQTTHTTTGVYQIILKPTAAEQTYQALKADLNAVLARTQSSR